MKVPHLVLVRRHESSRLRQLWLRKKHLRTGPWRAEELGAPRFGLDRSGAVKIPVQHRREPVEASLRNFIDSHAAWVIEGC
jgi:hypothetical protein